jgi:putative phosphoribosyl transferase
MLVYVFMKRPSAPTTALSLAVPAGGARLAADVVLPQSCHGLVVFAHGSGSSRHSPRNRFVAEELQDGGLGTMLIDLLTEEEEAADVQTAEYRFDILFLANRLVAITDWVIRQQRFADLGLGYFGASTGAAAALLAAAERPLIVRAVVSRGGRPDLAAPGLPNVLAPTLFIVGSEDRVVLELNREAMAELPEQTPCRLEIVPGATHLFEEPGALDQVARLARSWFLKHLGSK